MNRRVFVTGLGAVLALASSLLSARWPTRMAVPPRIAESSAGSGAVG